MGDEFFERERENCFGALTERKMGEKISVTFRKKKMNVQQLNLNYLICTN